ncbi:MAG: histidinol dehydrogenase [Lentihominibacter sp.]|jgi:histidinol dehydrogenase
MIRIYEKSLDELNRKEEILIRNLREADISESVSEIIKDVATNGDEALRYYSKKFDGFVPDTIEVSREEIERVYEEYSKSSPETISALENAAARITRFHQAQLREDFELTEKKDSDGSVSVLLMQKVNPLKRVGLYTPGGTASYPSTLLMNAIPARIAGVEEIIMASPPSKGGTIAPVILAAACIAGVDRVFRVGGVQAIAAFTYGTESIPAVDIITGPGNAYVAEAKKQVFGKVGVDMIAGPSEILIIAEDSPKGKVNEDAVILAADLISQAEHDTMATAVLITTDKELGFAVADEIEIQLKELPREEIAREAIENYGKIIIVDSMDEALDLANELAPEHLELYVNNPFQYMDRIRNAGSVFLGKNCPEAIGDYYAGPNQILPTNGTARFRSPLSVDDFVKKTSFTYYTIDSLERDAGDVIQLAREEGLEGHAKSTLARIRKK